MTTALICTNEFQLHDTGEHPERRERYAAVVNALVGEQDLWKSLAVHKPHAATDEEILRCHTPQTVRAIAEACAISGNKRASLDADTIVSQKSDGVARLAAGGACLAVDLIARGEAENAFVACRPPGHHATVTHSMGFCLYNNVAIAARYAQAKYPAIKNVLIVDFDVHHGNGSQDIFYADDSVYYYSLHQFPWYPGTGKADERGKDAGEGFNLNIPLAPATPAEVHMRHFEEGLELIAKSFAPDLIFVSAGFDAHVADPLGHLMLTDADYSAMTKRLREWANAACQGRLVSCLEGGYNLRTLGATVKAHVQALL